MDKREPVSDIPLEKIYKVTPNKSLSKVKRVVDNENKMKLVSPVKLNSSTDSCQPCSELSMSVLPVNDSDAIEILHVSAPVSHGMAPSLPSSSLSTLPVLETKNHILGQSTIVACSKKKLHVKTPVKQVSSENENRIELQAACNEGTALIQTLKAALRLHRTKTFFRPDVPFIKGMGAAISQIECGFNKIGQLLSSTSDATDKSGIAVSTAIDITPPASEAGTDGDPHNESNNDTSSSATQNNRSLHNSTRLSLRDDNRSGNNSRLSIKNDVIAGTSLLNPEHKTDVQGNTDTVKKLRGSYKRKRESLKLNDSEDNNVQIKKPKRSLLSSFLQKKGDTAKNTNDASDDDDDDDDDDSKPGKEYEVEKILDYDRIKGKCLYQVRWRGYGSSDDTWEPLENLTGCEDLLLAFIRTRLVERSKITDPEELKIVLMPCEDGVKSLLRTAFYSHLTKPRQNDVEAALPLLHSGKTRIKEMKELDEDIDRLVAIKDCHGDRFRKLYADLQQQLVLRECRQQREVQKAELRRWEREMSRICSAPAPLSVVNDVDLSLPPKDFVYINQYIAGTGINIPQDPVVGCECTDCGASQNACCPKQMSSFFAYSKHGRLKVSLGTAIYECNKMCACVKAGTCLNRVVQKGRTIQLTIFRTDNNRGWGVKAGETIRAGSFVTEYVGEVISSEEAERRGQVYDARGCTYLFDLDYNKGDLNPYTVDAAKYGNVSHFINHSCDPNLVVFNVWVNCLDPDLPKLALFAIREIKKGEEITFDYNSPSARPQQPIVLAEGEHGESSLLHDLQSPGRSVSGSMDQALRKTPKRGIANGKTRCRCGAANCRQFFF